MTTWVKQSLRAIVSDMALYDGRDMGDIPLQIVDSFSWRIESVYRELLATEAHGELNTVHEREILTFVENAYYCIQQFQEQAERCGRLMDEHSIASQVICDGSVGRPAFFIPYAVLEHLLDIHLTVPKISKLLGVSVSTVRRRMTEYGISVRNTYSNIGDEELDRLIESTNRSFPTWGVRQMYGHLISVGFRLQYDRIRESLRRVDPQGSYMRRLRHLRRRKYSVAGPQSLWHIDGNHKLIR